MPFMGTLITPENTGTLATRLYRKPMHTNQYLHWDSHYHTQGKYNIINTLTDKNFQQKGPTTLPTPTTNKETTTKQWDIWSYLMYKAYAKA